MVRGVAFDWAAFLNSIVNFVIVAAFLYFFIVVPMNRIIARRRRNETLDEAQASMPEDIALLQEIRDLLKRQDASGARGTPGGSAS